MDLPTLADRIHGGVAGAVIGDALGSLTETLSRRQIGELYGRIDDFREFAFKPFGQTRQVGAWTDDSSLIVYGMRTMIATGGISAAGVIAALIDWSTTCAAAIHSGPTTRRALERIAAGEDPALVGFGDDGAYSGTSNGGAMKVAPAGWLNPGDIPGAVDAAALICLPTHNTSLAVSGAAAIAAACATAAIPGATVDDLVEAGIEGARLGEVIGGERGREVAGPSIACRIALAARTAARADDFDTAVRDLGEVVGSSLATADSVPAALGLVVAAAGDVDLAVVGSANIGDDTDTVGTMAGAVAGTFGGLGAVRRDWYHRVCETNGLDLGALARDFASMALLRRAPNA